MLTITPFLWFDNQAEEAVNFYTSIFKNSRVDHVSRYGDAGPGPKGAVMTASFNLDGQQFIALNGGPQFTFSPAISFVVNCDTQQDIDHYWSKLSMGGRTDHCGWLTDKFGVSWQIVPTILGQLMTEKDAEKSGRVMKALLQMTKLDIEALKQAHEGGAVVR